MDSLSSHRMEAGNDWVRLSDVCIYVCWYLCIATLIEQEVMEVFLEQTEFQEGRTKILYMHLKKSSGNCRFSSHAKSLDTSWVVEEGKAEMDNDMAHRHCFTIIAQRKIQWQLSCWGQQQHEQKNR